MNRFLLSLLLVLLVSPALAQDQQDPDDEALPVFISSRYHCDLAGLDALIEHERERTLPILQELVDDGTIISAGIARHQWGDEYNLLTWMSGADMDAALAGWEAMTRRYTEMYPDDNLFIETCPKHQDRFATRQVWAAQEDGPDIDPENPPTLAISSYICDFQAMGDIVDEWREKSTPISQALVDEGALGSEGVYTHEWGDEWNLIITRTAADVGALDSALNMFGERYQSEHGAEAATMLEEHCTAHKDNIYWITMSTN